MPYKDIEKRRLNHRKNASKKVKVTCCVCGKEVMIRKDTAYKHNNTTCDGKCKSEFLRRLKSNSIDEDKFIEEYLQGEGGYQTLCKKYHIGGKRGLDILKNKGIKIESGIKIKKRMFDGGCGSWVRAERRICKKCGKEFKFRKSNTDGYFCSLECYRKYCGRTGIEIRFKDILEELNIKYKEQYKINKSYFDFYLLEYNILIECDGSYWHSSVKAVARDRRKDKLALEKGMLLFRFDEYSINNNSEEIKIFLLRNVGIDKDKEAYSIAQKRIKKNF